MTLSQKIVILRKTKGITQDELARALDVSRQSVHKWESGQCFPEVPKIIKMKELFGISFDDLLDDGFDIPVPEKKKRRTPVPKASSDDAESISEISKAEENAPDGKTDAPVLKNSALSADDELIEEIKLEVIDAARNDAAQTGSEEKNAPAHPSDTEKEKVQDEKRRGLFGKLFGRRK